MNIQPDINQQIAAMVEHSNVVSKLTALLEAWEVAVGEGNPAALTRIRQGDEYVQALAAFIDSRVKRAVLGARPADRLGYPPEVGDEAWRIRRAQELLPPGYRILRNEAVQ